MPRITGSYPRDQDLLIEGAVDAGIFGSKSDALREFVRTYFENHDNERIAAAVTLYERERITLGEAARLAAVDGSKGIQYREPRGGKVRLGSSLLESNRGTTVPDSETRHRTPLLPKPNTQPL